MKREKILLLFLIFISKTILSQINSSFIAEAGLYPCYSFTSNSTGNISSYHWDIYDFTSPVFPDTSKISWCFGDTGCYEVKLTVYDLLGDSSVSSQMICITANTTIFIPTAFTPNADGLNDFFFAEGTAIQQEGFQMEIYSRWGQTIFSTQNIYEGWDGKTSDHNVATDGPYLVAIVWYDMQHVKHEYKNTVLLMR